MKKIILLIVIFSISTSIAFSYNKEMTDLLNGYYEGSDDIDNLVENALSRAKSNVDRQTYQNIIIVMKVNMKVLGSKRQTYNALKKILEENEPLLSDDNVEYMTSVADLMGALIRYSTFNELMKLSGESTILYEDALKISPNNFSALLGYGISIAFKPKFVGGGIDKALPIFLKAEMNAKEAWEKHVVYIWLSQAYMKIGDKKNYKKYITLAESIFKDSPFLNEVKTLNEKDKSVFR